MITLNHSQALLDLGQTITDKLWARLGDHHDTPARASHPTNCYNFQRARYGAKINTAAIYCAIARRTRSTSLSR